MASCTIWTLRAPRKCPFCDNLIFPDTQTLQNGRENFNVQTDGITIIELSINKRNVHFATIYHQFLDRHPRLRMCSRPVRAGLLPQNSNLLYNRIWFHFVSVWSHRTFNVAWAANSSVPHIGSFGWTRPLVFYQTSKVSWWVEFPIRIIRVRLFRTFSTNRGSIIFFK